MPVTLEVTVAVAQPASRAPSTARPARAFIRWLFIFTVPSSYSMVSERVAVPPLTTSTQVSLVVALKATFMSLTGRLPRTGRSSLVTARSTVEPLSTLMRSLAPVPCAL
ncbi:hypothetical protein D3C86_1872260 [compost metagenome]